MPIPIEAIFCNNEDIKIDVIAIASFGHENHFGMMLVRNGVRLSLDPFLSLEG